MTDQDPILELSGVTVTHESISSSEGDIALATVEHVHVEEGSLPFLKSKWLYPRAHMLSLLGALPLGVILPLGPERLSGVINIIWFCEFLVIGAIGICVCLALRKKVSFSVQLRTSQGTIVAYSTSDKEEAMHVKDAIIGAMGKPGGDASKR